MLIMNIELHGPCGTRTPSGPDNRKRQNQEKAEHVLDSVVIVLSAMHS